MKVCLATLKGRRKYNDVMGVSGGRDFGERPIILHGFRKVSGFIFQLLQLSNEIIMCISQV